MRVRRVVGITGSRSEYDCMVSVYRAVAEHPGLSLSLVVTGAHLSKHYGLTVQEIEKDGFVIAEMVESLLNGDRDVTRVKSAGIQLYGLAQAIDRLRPDILIVFGDREESITTALVGAYLNIPVAHVSGGDRVIGNVDDSVRHAVTKLAHLHFATNGASMERILRLGEQPFRVFNTGNPALDRLADTELMGREELLHWYGFSKSEWTRHLLVVIQHVISSEIDKAYHQMSATMEAVKELECNAVVIYPNSDAGSQDIIRCLHAHEDLAHIKIHRHVGRKEFVNTLRHASCLVGNSSAGLLEAPFLRLPAVNVGNRQQGRMHADNVQFVPHDKDQIKQAILKACGDSEYRKKIEACPSPYGDGKSGERIASILASIPLDANLLTKDITY